MMIPLNASHHLIHPEVKPSWDRLALRLKGKGVDLQAASAYRSPERQMVIWNEKVLGKRPVLDDAGLPLKREDFNDWDWCQKILRWSALPGASRHHWGSEIDVIDGAVLTEKTTYQLVDTETWPGGLFEQLHYWLDQWLQEDDCEGFFRPYQKDLGGVAPERWHLSYRPLAEKITKEWNFPRFEGLLNHPDLLLGQELKLHASELWERFGPFAISELP